MPKGRPFVVTVASEKGGVGKTTVSTNLAVYLKALREDLPVTVASFDNHFTVDSMFAIAGGGSGSVAGLFSGEALCALTQLGEYGVQFIPSAHGLAPPDDDLWHLSRVLHGADLPGIFILDTRPVLDYFTRSALLAADLVLIPVKDRPSLMNAASLHRAVGECGGDTGKLWILPSLIDRRLRLRGEVGLEEFLSASAKERGYRVIDVALTKSPRVEGLTTGFSSRVHPVITHASGTAVHRQFRELADFVLERHDESLLNGVRRHPAPRPAAAGRPTDRTCPNCGEPTGREETYLIQAPRRRRLGYVHRSCVGGLLQSFDIPYPPETEGGLVLRVEGAGFSAEEAVVSWVMLDFAGQRRGGGSFNVDSSWSHLIEEVAGRSLYELGQEWFFLVLSSEAPETFASGEGRARLTALRRSALGEVGGL